jgi:hypothetical protein
MRAEDFDAKFDAGDDVTGDLDLAGLRRPGPGRRSSLGDLLARLPLRALPVRHAPSPSPDGDSCLRAGHPATRVGVKMGNSSMIYQQQDGTLLITTSIGPAQKALNVRRDGRVALEISRLSRSRTTCCREHESLAYGTVMTSLPPLGVFRVSSSASAWVASASGTVRAIGTSTCPSATARVIVSRSCTLALVNCM